jgi:hypothetical protein
MPNETDQDRLNSRMQNANVVDLDAYRASVRASTSASYLDRGTLNMLKIGALVLLCLFFVFRFAR